MLELLSEPMQVSAVKTNILHVCKGMIEDSPPPMKRRDLVNYIELCISVIMLGEVQEECRSILVDSDVYP